MIRNLVLVYKEQRGPSIEELPILHVGCWEQTGKRGKMQFFSGERIWGIWRHRGIAVSAYFRSLFRLIELYRA